MQLLASGSIRFTLDGVPEPFRYALAFLALLQVTAAILNFLPVPGLDGYGVIEPWLSLKIRRQVEPFAPFGLLAVFGLLWVPEINGVFFQVVDTVLRTLSSGEPHRARTAEPRCALTANRNSGGVARTQPRIAEGVGRRRKVALSSSAGRRVA